MRVLLVSHRFPPAHQAGTESYTAELGRELAARGHAVRVFATEKDVSRRDFALVEREWRGIAVSELVNNLYYRSFRETWDCPSIDRLFAELLERARPDVVHFQHLMYLSLGCVEEAARRGVPVLFTLHDYWFHCARLGQRVHADRSVCERIDFGRCGECLTSFKWSQSPLERTTGRWLARVRGATGVDLSGLARTAARLALRGAPETPPPVDADRAAELALDVAARDAAFRERVVPRVWRFLAPSRFLRERYVDWGVAPERIQFLQSGVDPASSPRARSAGSGSGPLRVAFIGTIAPHKGVHVLLDAWSSLSAGIRARAQLEIIGPWRTDSDYRRRIARRARELGVTLRGALPRERVAAELAEIDCVVVPSTWWENAPLVILEAVAARTPVLASDLGGSPELVLDYQAGATFRAGDAGDLARVLALWLESPRELASFYAGSARPPTVAEHAVRVEALYQGALAAQR